MNKLPENFTLSMLPLSMNFGQRRCTLRKLRPKDADRLLEFLQTHSSETLRLRYGYSGLGTNLKKAREMLEDEGGRHLILAFLEKDGKFSRIVALGHYTMDESGHSAEPAFLVREDHRCLGMATLLLDALMAVARSRNLTCFYAQTLADNFAMLGIFLKRGGRLQAIAGTDGVEVFVPLS